MPELAWVGMSEEHAKVGGINYAVARAEYQNTVRGCVRCNEGFLKLIFDRDSGKILGIHVFGELACDLINYGATSVNQEDTVFDMLHFVFPASTYHTLYHSAASEARLRLTGARDIAVATAWKRIKGVVLKTLDSFKHESTTEEFLTRVFAKIDHAGNGKLSQEELHNAFESLGIHLQEEQLKEAIVEVAGDPNEEFVSFESFMAMFSST